MTTRLTGRDPRTGAGLAVVFTQDGIVSVDADEEAEDWWLSPGLVDLQVNGYGGIDLNSGELTPRDVEPLAQSLLARGTTCFLPTLITASESSIGGSESDCCGDRG